MYLELFHKYFPEVAEKETRFLSIDEGPGIPAGQYAFIEAYCTDPDCDCERVMLNVTEKDRGVVATISYGFNPAKTREWFDGPNPFLDPLNPQSEYAEELLKLVQEIVLDEEYEERLKRHYRMVKEAVRTGAPTAKSRKSATGGRTTQNLLGQAERTKRWRKLQKSARRNNRRR
jgi:hypothetical protein